MSLCRSESQDEIQPSQPPARQRAVLLVLAFCVLVASLGSGLRYVRCLTGCCVPVAGVSVAGVLAAGESAAGESGAAAACASMLATADVQKAGCCCCATETSEEASSEDDSPEDDSSEDDSSEDDPSEDVPSTAPRACEDGGACCVEISFDMDEAVASAALDDAALLALPVLCGDDHPTHSPAGARQFACAPKRGPPPPHELPRIDRGTALRACTVLLI
ncbi:MAG: hypothetical protein AB8H80_03015 [Planctomycetota bacterium]